MDNHHAQSTNMLVKGTHNNFSLPQIQSVKQMGSSNVSPQNQRSQNKYGSPGRNDKSLNNSAIKIRDSDAKNNTHNKSFSSFSSIKKNPILGNMPRISDMVKRKEDFGVEGYSISKFDGKSYQMTKAYARSNLSKTKSSYYLADMIKVKEKIPSPDKYDSYKSFVQTTGKVTILKSERQTMFTDHERKLAKDKYPAPNQYEPKIRYKVKGTAKQSSVRQPVAADDIVHGQETPSCYDTVNMKFYKSRIPEIKLIQESDMEKKLKNRAIEKTNHPSPVTYDITKSLERISQNNRANTVMTFSKEKTKDFASLYAQSKSHIPGPNSYKVDFAKIYKPMRKR